MANEFIIKNGFHSKGDSQVTGSLNVSSTLTVNGSAVGAAFPFSGDAQITGSLNVSSSITTFDINMSTWTLGADGGNNYYYFTGPGDLGGTEQNPDIHLTRGQKYRFYNPMDAHPFQIQDTGGSAFSTGVTNNGVQLGFLSFDVPMDGPTHLKYQCTAHAAMVGNIYIADARVASGSFSGSFQGDGSSLTGVSAFPFTGNAQITGSLIVSGSTPLTIQGGTENADTVLLVEEVGGVDLLTVKGDGEVVINNANNGLTGKLSFGNGISDGFIYMQDQSTAPSSKYSIPQRTSNNDSSLQFWVGNTAGGPKLFPHKDTSQGLADRSVIEIDLYNSSNNSRGLDFIVGGAAVTTTYQPKLWRFFSWDGINDPDSGNVERLSISNSPLTTGGDAEITISASRVGIGAPSPSASLEINPPSGSFPSLIVSGSSEFIGNVSGSATSTASFGTYIGDGSQLSGISGGSAFPFTGDAQITGSLIISASATSQSLSVIGSGSTVFNVIGSEGTLFAIEDDLDGTLFTVNDRSGIPMFEVSASGRIVAEEGESIIRSQRPIVTHTSDFSITSSLDFAGKYHIVGGGITCSINTGSLVPTGAEFEFFQTSSAGNFLFITGSPHVDVIVKNDNMNLAGQGSGASLKYIGGSTFHLVGDLT